MVPYIFEAFLLYDFKDVTITVSKTDAVGNFQSALRSQQLNAVNV
jgi:hypothetical protein